MTTNTTKVEREARLRWVPIAKMRVNPLAQRELNKSWVDAIAVDLDIEQLGAPTVNERDGHFNILDGQHRIEALKETGWGDQQIQCWTYAGLSDDDEAEVFLKLNNVKAVDAFAKFKVGVSAGRDVPCDIDRIVRAQGLVVCRDQQPGAVRAVGALQVVYNRGGAKVLARSLGIIRDAYGDAGFEAKVIEGIGLLCARYNGDLSDEIAAEKLGKAHGGVSGLTNKAEQVRRQTGNAKNQCVAAAAVDIINSGRGSKKLPSWWKSA